MADKPLNGNHVHVPASGNPRVVSLRVLTRELKSLRDRQQDPWAYRVIGDALRVLEGPKPVIAPIVPRLNIKCETIGEGLAGTTFLNVVRVEQEEDGSFTAVTDHWPHT